MTQFGGGEFSAFSVPLVFVNRYFVLEPGADPLVTVLSDDGAGNIVVEIYKNQPRKTDTTLVTTNPSRVVTVTEKATGKFLYKIRPGSDTSIALGTLKDAELWVRVSDRHIQAPGITVNYSSHGNKTGVVVYANGDVGVGGMIPPFIYQAMEELGRAPR
jgi:hypothetical protein